MVVMSVEVMLTVEVGLVMGGTRTGGPVALLKSLVAELVVQLAFLFYNLMRMTLVLFSASTQLNYGPVVTTCRT